MAVDPNLCAAAKEAVEAAFKTKEDPAESESDKEDEKKKKKKKKPWKYEKHSLEALRSTAEAAEDNLIEVVRKHRSGFKGTAEFVVGIR